MLRREEAYSIVEIEMLLNYFPHAIWKSEMDLGRLRDRFYFPIIDQIKEEVDKVDNRQFLSLF